MHECAGVSLEPRLTSRVLTPARRRPILASQCVWRRRLASLVALALGAWAAEAATSVPPKCSALNTQRHGRLVHGGNVKRTQEPGPGTSGIAGLAEPSCA